MIKLTFRRDLVEVADDWWCNYYVFPRCVPLLSQPSMLSMCLLSLGATGLPLYFGTKRGREEFKWGGGATVIQIFLSPFAAGKTAGSISRRQFKEDLLQGRNKYITKCSTKMYSSSEIKDV